jgi:DNA-binding IclR family transcriptional regulator
MLPIASPTTPSAGEMRNIADVQAGGSMHLHPSGVERTPDALDLPGSVADGGGRPPVSRGVLEGAFAVLDALAHADDGLGLSALTRESGLAKSSAHRLAEQLVMLEAVQRFGQRYYVGPRMLRIGRGWQPDPVLRRCAQGPVHNLAVQSRAAASLRILHDRQLRYICAGVPRGQPYVADHGDPESIARTATGRVLFAAQPTNVVALPDCWTRSEWRKLRDSLRDPRATVIDHQDAVSGICCVSAPVWWPDGRCAGAVTVSVLANDLPVGLPALVSHTAGRIGGALRRVTAE